MGLIALNAALLTKVVNEPWIILDQDCIQNYFGRETCWIMSTSGSFQEEKVVVPLAESLCNRCIQNHGAKCTMLSPWPSCSVHLGKRPNKQLGHIALTEGWASPKYSSSQHHQQSHQYQRQKYHMQNIGLLEKGQSMKVKGRRRSGTNLLHGWWSKQPDDRQVITEGRLLPQLF
jgi:hypothetical protein